MQSNLEEFEHRLKHARWTLSDSAPKILPGCRALDIGCGGGSGVAAAVELGAQMAVGIDINLRFFQDFIPEEFPEVCRHFNIDPKRALMIEADIFKTDFGPNSFDLCFMLDAIEHVPNPAAFIEYAYRQLAPGGLLVVDCGGLYYSAVGHHLWHIFPPAEYPWVHLWADFDELLVGSGVTQWSLDAFRELNKTTGAELRKAFTDAGFDILSDKSNLTVTPTPALAAVRSRIRSEYLADEAALLEESIRLVGVRY